MKTDAQTDRRLTTALILIRELYAAAVKIRSLGPRVRL
jgi:hypothetical protein